MFQCVFKDKVRGVVIVQVLQVKYNQNSNKILQLSELLTYFFTTSKILSESSPVRYSPHVGWLLFPIAVVSLKCAAVVIQAQARSTNALGESSKHETQQQQQQSIVKPTLNCCNKHDNQLRCRFERAPGIYTM